jgi:hypothetical protein
MADGPLLADYRTDSLPSRRAALPGLTCAPFGTSIHTPMRALSLVLLVFVSLAVIGLLYEFAADHRRAELRARHKRDLERINTPPQFRSRVQSNDGR